MSEPKKARLLWWIIGILVSFGTLYALVSLTDNNVSNNGTYYSNVRTGAKTDALGNAYSTESSPDRAYSMNRTVLSTILSGRLVTAGLPAPAAPAVLQDSTEAVDVRGYNSMALMMYPVFDASVSAVAVAIQVRWHYYGQVDSTSTFIEQGSRAFAAAQPTGLAGGLVRDSLGTLFNIPATATGASRYSVAGVDSLATPDEQVYVFTNVSGVNRGRLLRIFSPNSSQAACGPYMSIRVRYLNSYNASGAANGVEPNMRLSATLVGWR